MEEPNETNNSDGISKLLRDYNISSIEGDTSEEVVVPDPQEEDIVKTSDSIPKDVLTWLTVGGKAAPEILSKSMVDVTNRIGVYIAYVVLRRLSKLDSLLSHVESMERLIFNKSRQSVPKSIKDVKSEYKAITEVLESMLEFSRKFSMQAEDLIKDPDRDELLSLVRSLDPESLKSLKDAVKTMIKTKVSKGSLERGQESNGQKD